MRDGQEVNQERLSRQDGVHTRLKLWQDGLQHLVNVSWMEKALCSLCDIKVQWCEVDGVTSEFVWMGEQLIVEGMVKRAPRHAKIVYVLGPITSRLVKSSSIRHSRRT